MTAPPAERGCALVTGASRGIGAAIARSLATDGWAVVVNYREDSAAASAVVERIRSEGGRATPARCDVRSPDAAELLIETAETVLGLPPLVLVNNAGVVRDGLLYGLEDNAWEEVLDTNLSAAFRLTRGALGPMMRERFGRIVNVSSVIGQVANPGQAAYAASKAGLVALTRTLAVEVARLGITANAVAPGPVETAAAEPVLERLTARVPARRPGRPEEVASCVSFLASERAGYVTGSLLTVDGGLTA